MHRIRCSEIWGGVSDADLDVCTAGLTASLYSSACEGGKGGDIYYFSVCGSDLLTRVALADVVGHGAAVSDVSQWMYDSMAARMNTLEGDGVLADLNRLAVDRGLKALTTAAVIGFYIDDGQLYFAYAGHPPALVWRASRPEWRPQPLAPRPDAANLPLGVTEDAPYDQQQVPLSAGDRILLYTDGVLEAPDARGELFGARRLLEILNHASARQPSEIKQAVLGALRQHTGGALAHDDVTLMVMEVR